MGTNDQSVPNPFAFACGLVDRARREVTLARMVGELAVAKLVADLRVAIDDAATARAPSEAPDVVGERSPAAEPGGHETGPVPDADDLALAGYDHLPAAHVVAKLAGLDRDERDAIEAYELAGRHRRTILGRLEQLRDEP